MRAVAVWDTGSLPELESLEELGVDVPSEAVIWKDDDDCVGPSGSFAYG